MDDAVDDDRCDDKQVECWENQRYVLFRGWGPFRLPTDRPLWSNRKGDRRHHLESFLLPCGYCWDGEWHLEYPSKLSETAPRDNSHLQVLDPESDYGWLYAPDFTVPTKYCSTKSSPIAIVRRRRWVRRIRKLEEDNSLSDVVGLYQLWSQTTFYGFTCSNSDSAAAIAAESQRQHESFHRLSRFAKRSAIASVSPTSLVSSIPVTADDNEEPSTPASIPPSNELRVAPKILRYVYLYGVACCLRGELWKLWSTGGASSSPSHPTCDSPRTFSSLSAIATQTKEGTDFNEIVQDVARTAPRHPFFEGKGSVGSLRLRNLLLTLSLSPQIPGYHQAFSYIAALFLLNMGSEAAYDIILWMFQEILPPGYHEHYLLQYDLTIFSELLHMYYPQVDANFHTRQIDVSVFASGWLQALFCAHFPFSTAARFFDVMFAEGNSTILVRLLLAFVKLHEKYLLQVDSSCSLGQFANDWARQQFDAQPLLDIMSEDRLSVFVSDRRKKLMPTK